MKLLLVFNPQASSGRAKKYLPEIRQAFESGGISVDILQTRCKDHATEQIAARSLSAYDGIVAAGGDGTIFELLNSLYHKKPAQRVPLGVIPLGTGNAFARDLDLLPGDWQKAVSIISAGQVRKVDVGCVNTQQEQFYFLNIIGMGFAVDAGLTAVKLKRLGTAAYTLATLWQTMKLKSYPLCIEIDGLRIEQDNIFIEISNTRYTGTYFKIAPGAAMDDGLFDIILLRKLPRWRLLRLFPSIYSGNHVNYEEVTIIRGKCVKILGPSGYLLAADGEFRGMSPVEITCKHKDLEIFCS